MSAPTLEKKRLPGVDKINSAGPMKETSYDQASGLLIAVLVMLGFVVMLMFLVWLSTRMKFQPVVVPVSLVEGLGGGGKGDGTPNSEQEFADVPPEELKDLQESTVDQTLQNLTDAISTQQLNVENMEAQVSGLGNGEGTGQGDGRGEGPGGNGTAKELPEWQVKFSATSLDLYARQLDFFGIELGALGGGKKTVDYAKNLAAAKPTVRSADGKLEQRRYLVWRKGALADADRQLLTKAGIDHSGRVILQFIPPPVEQQMAELEVKNSGGRKTSQIRRTVFGVRAVGAKYEFFVAEQEYRGGA